MPIHYMTGCVAEDNFLFDYADHVDNYMERFPWRRLCQSKRKKASTMSDRRF